MLLNNYVDGIIDILGYILMFLLDIVPFILSIAVMTLLERKAMSSIQRRRGPSVAGFFGILQPLADGLKLLLKEVFYTSNSNVILFFLSPVLTFFFTLVIWLIVPLSVNFVLLEMPFILLFVLIISSLSVQTIIFSGWSSNSKYAFLGSIRSASQMISYELCMSTIFASIIVMSGSFSIFDIVNSQECIWFIVPLFPMWVLFVVCSLAETNRAPFDLAEAEAELVAGYNVEYSAISFALFFLAEYGNILIMSVLSTIFFFGGWFLPINSSFFCGEILVFVFALKVSLNVLLFILVRAAFPRYRYDQLMGIGWKVLLPLSCALLILQCSLLLCFDMFTFF